jgi:glycine cleavage system T protein (aminomethyltransferase)
MSVGSAFDERALGLNVRRQWREWSGVFSSSAYAPHIDIEYNALRNAAGLIDVSPLFKYQLRGPDAERLVDRVITREAAHVKPGRVIYTPWCDSAGRVIDDGTLMRRDDGSWFWTAAEGQLRWLRLNARGLDVEIEDRTEQLAALAVQGPLSRALLEAAAQTDLSDLRYFGRRSLELAGATVDVSRTGYTGDLGYELWIERADALAVWDALMETGTAYAVRPVGILALDVVRVEAGLIMAGVDYTSAKFALTPEQSYSPFELGLGPMVKLDKDVPFVGQAALRQEQTTGGPTRRLVGLDLDWADLQRLYAKHGLSPALSAHAWRDEIPIFEFGEQVGRATSGTWSLVLKKNLALGTVVAGAAETGTELELEWSVEGERGRIGAQVVDLPFFDPPRKRE